MELDYNSGLWKHTVYSLSSSVLNNLHRHIKPQTGFIWINLRPLSQQHKINCHRIVLKVVLAKIISSGLQFKQREVFSGSL